MTMPALVNNYKQKAAITQLKKVYTTLNQAFRLSEVDNQSSIYWDTSKGTSAYFETYWKPYLKVLRYCTGTYDDAACNYKKNTPWLRANGTRDIYGVVDDTTRTSLILNDGTFISILLYSGYGSTEGELDENGNYTSGTYGRERRIIVDLNASQNPNQFGKDTFLFERIPGKGIMPYGYNSDDDTVNQNCSKSGSGFMCAAKLMKDGWEIKDGYPW